MRAQLQEKRRKLKRKRIIKRIVSLTVISLAIFFIYKGLNKDYVEPTKEEIEEIIAEEEVIKEEIEEIVEEESLEGKDINPLTGEYILEEKTKIRPISIMIENQEDAVPQSGLTNADIVYEMDVEYPITRFLALYQHTDIEKIGPVRSARHYFLDSVFDHDAVYVHYGSSYIADRAFKTLNAPTLNGINGTIEELSFWHDKERLKKVDSWHTLYTNPAKIMESWEKVKDYRKDKRVDNDFKFYEDDTSIIGRAADELVIPYTSNQTVKYEYNEKNKTYDRYQTTGKEMYAHVDAETNEQISPKNIIIQFVKSYKIAGDKDGRIELELVGEGEGYYLTNGNYRAIRWMKTAHRNTTIYKDLDGNEIKLNKGKTWIQMFNRDRKSEVTFSEKVEEIIEDEQNTSTES